MDFKKVALILPYNDKLEILFQNRKKIMKHYTKDYGFFGGKVEEGETVEQALKREIMEELEIDVSYLEDLRFFKKFNFKSRELDISAELNVFLCKMLDINTLKCNEGEPVIINLSEVFNLNISPWDKQILTEIQKHLALK